MGGTLLNAEKIHHLADQMIRIDPDGGALLFLMIWAATSFYPWERLLPERPVQPGKNRKTCNIKWKENQKS